MKQAQVTKSCFSVKSIILTGESTFDLGSDGLENFLNRTLRCTKKLGITTYVLQPKQFV